MNMNKPKNPFAAVRLSAKILNIARTYAEDNGMKLGKLFEFAVLDYITKNQPKKHD